MEELREYDVEFIKLKDGSHQFNYNLTDDFFKSFNSSLSAKSIEVVLNFIKATSMFTLSFDINGIVEVDCDRCLSRISFPLKDKHTVLVKITEQALENEDDLIYLHPNDYKINISQHIFDFVNLSLPIKKTCSDVGLKCDPTVTDKISSVIDFESVRSDVPERDTDENEEEQI